ncbi:MAG: CcdB family protein [Rhodoferax sp.]|nr:CcdB family protein [Rhodoferax sp.]
MAQFDVYTNPIVELRESHPYVMVIQSHFLKRPIAVMAIPLARMDEDTSPVTTLNPRLDVAGETLLLETLTIGSYEPGDLRRPVANLSHSAAAIWDALDFALHGY